MATAARNAYRQAGLWVALFYCTVPHLPNYKCRGRPARFVEALVPAGGGGAITWASKGLAGRVAWPGLEAQLLTVLVTEASLPLPGPCWCAQARAIMHAATDTHSSHTRKSECAS